MTNLFIYHDLPQPWTLTCVPVKNHTNLACGCYDQSLRLLTQIDRTLTSDLQRANLRRASGDPTSFSNWHLFW